MSYQIVSLSASSDKRSEKAVYSPKKQIRRICQLNKDLCVLLMHQEQTIGELEYTSSVQLVDLNTGECLTEMR